MKLKKLKKELLSSIEEVCRESDDIVLDPKKGFHPYSQVAAP